MTIGPSGRADDDVRVPLADIDMAGGERRRPELLRYVEGAQLVEPACQATGERARHMLCDHDRPRKVGGSRDSTVSSAGGPPVEAPMSTRPWAGGSLIRRSPASQAHAVGVRSRCRLRHPLRSRTRSASLEAAGQTGPRCGADLLDEPGGKSSISSDTAPPAS